MAPVPTGRHGRPRRTRTGVLSRRQAGCGWPSAGLTLGVSGRFPAEGGDWVITAVPVCMPAERCMSKISLALGSPAEE